LTVAYASSNTSVATVAGNTVTIVGGGSTTITASQAGNTNYAAATSVPQTLTVNKVAQTISGVTSTLSKTYGDAAYSLGATVGSGLTINYTTSNASVATIAANGTVTIVAPGTTTLTASQAGDARYSAAADATQALTVSKATPTLSFNSSNSTTVNGTVTLNATAAAIGAVASTGNVTYTSSNNAVVSINGTVATGVAAGTATITASQAADSNYNSTTATQTFTVSSGPTTLAAGDIMLLQYDADAPDKFTFVTLVDLNPGTVINFTDNGFDSTTTGRTGEGFLTFTVPAGTTYTAGTTFTWNNGMTIAGTPWSSAAPTSFDFNASGDQLSAFQGSTANWATQSGITLVAGLIQKTTWLTSGTAAAGTSYQPSGLSTSYIVSLATENGYFANGNSTTASVTVGDTKANLQALFADGINKWYNNATGPLTAPTYSISIKQAQTITFGSLSSVIYGDTAFSLGATASSGLSVSYASSNSSVATINGTTVNIVGAGNTTITASQSGNANYSAATSVLQTLTVNPAGLTITANNTTKAYNSTLATPASGSTAFTSSGLKNGQTIGSVTLNYAGGYNATDSVGNYTITPSAATGGNFTASNYALTYANGTLTVTAIAPGAPTITGITPGDQQLSVAFTAPASYGGSEITNYEYSTNGGSSWTTRSPAATTIPLSITGLTNGQTYNVQIRAVNSVGSGTATASTSGTPTVPSGALSTSGTLSAFSATYPAASAEQSFSVSGTGLTGSLTVSVPSGFEVSLTSGSGFGATATISASGTLASTAVYVRLAASSNAASYTGNITIFGGSAPTQNIAASGTVSQASQTITFGALATKNATDAAFALTGTVDSGLSITYTSSNTSVATVAGNTVTLVGAGSTTITASQAGNTNYAAATSVTQTLTVNKVAQTISGVNSTATKTYGDAAYSLGATVGSGLTINYTTSNASVATIAANGTVTIVGAGSATLTASQTGNGNYNAAADATQSLTVSKATPTLSFNSSNSTTVNGTVTLNATSAAIGAVASTGAVTYTSSNTSVATISTSTLSAVASGTTTITASQAADSNYNSTTATQIFTVTTGPTTLAAGDIAVIGYNASGSPDTITLLILKDLNPGTVFYVCDNEVGTAGGTTWSDTNEAEATFTVSAGQTIAAGTVLVLPWGNQAVSDSRFTWTGHTSAALGVTNSNFDDGIYVYTGSSPTATPTAFIYFVKGGSLVATAGTVPSGLTDGTTSINPTASASRYKLTGATYSGTAAQLLSAVGNLSNWESTAPGSASDWTFTITQSQSITFGALSAVTYGDSPFSLGATASSGLAVSYTSSNASVATVAANGTLTIVGAGNTTITANQTGNATYSAAANVTQSLTVNQKSLTGTFTANNKVYDGTTSATVATRSVTGKVGSDDVSLSGGTAAFADANVGIGKTVTLAGASLNGTAASNYSLGSVSTTTADITQAASTITFGALPAKTYGDSTFGLTATASSSLSVSYTSSNTSVATVAGSTVTVVGVGSTTITASQAGDSNYTAATNVTQTLTVSTKSLTGTFTASDKTYDGTTSATVATRAVTGTVGSDVVNHTGGTATFANATTGNGKTVTLAGATLTGAAASNYSLGSVSTTTANITQATPTISVAPTASNITIGQTLANSTLSGGNASVNGTYAFTTPSTAPALGISSQGVTFTPTDSTNYTAQTTSANVGVLCLAPTLTRATLPVAGGFTVNWNAATGAANYTVLHSASKNMTVATSVNTASTSLAITGLSNGLRYVQVRANNAAGASANSTQQVNQLQSIAAGATSYLSAPGDVGTNTVAGIFGSANEAGLAAGATDSASTTILLLNSNGATANTIFYNSSVNQWREGATAMDTTAIAQGKAFMLKNNTGSTDYFLLVGTPREGGSQPTVSLNPAGNYTLCTTGRTTPTTIANMNLNPGSGAGQFKAATKAKDADKIIVVDQTTGAATSYYSHPVHGWLDGLRAVPSATIPAGQGFFIKKASDSTFNTWTLPAE
jgi:hypothetical protein